jgi:hypothetical protein
MSGSLQQGTMLTPQMAAAASNLAALGSGRDNMLAHINPQEAAMLMRMGGKGNINPRTGIRQFDDGGGQGSDVSQSSQPAQNTAFSQPTEATPAGFTPNTTVPYTDDAGAAGVTNSPYNAAVLNSYGGAATTPTNAIPIDPTLWDYTVQQADALPYSQGPSGANPFLIGGSQFIDTPGNPNFVTDASGYGEFSPTGQQAYDTFISQQEASAKANDIKNSQGLGAFLGTPLGALSILGLPLGIGGALEAAGAVGVGASLGGFAGTDAAALSPELAATDIAEDLPAAGVEGGGAAVGGGTTAATDLGITGGTAAGADALDPFAGSTLPEIAAATPSDAASATAAAADAQGLADPFAGTTLGDATSSLASLGANPTLGELAAATPDDLVGDASANATTLGANAADTATFDDGTTALTGGGGVTADAAGPSTSLSTLDTTQFPGGFITPPDPATGLASGAGAGGGGAGGVGGWLSGLGDKLGAGLSDPFKLLGLGASGLGLINSMASQNKNVGNVSGNLTQQQALANQTNATGTALQGYLTSGTLPPGLMQQVQLAVQDSIQGIKAKYAANGMGPNSTPEQQDINRVLQNQASTIATIGQQLFSSGTADLQIDQNVLNQMLSANTSLNNQTNQAIANLARALSGTGSNTTTTTTTTPVGQTV